MDRLAFRVGRACLGALCVLLLTPALALAEGGSVRYSYEKVEIGDSVEWVLVPRAQLSLGGTVTKSKIIDAFEMLKKSKGSTYGGTTIRISGNLPKASVAINIDPKYSQYAIIIMAESVYTMTELGLPGVEFPGYAEGVVTRAEIPFAVYTLTLPMWRALPPSGLGPAQIMLSSGKVIDGPEFYERWGKKDQALLDELYAYLKGNDLYAMTSVLKLLPELKLPYIEQTLPLLSHKSRAVRELALGALAASRDDAKVLTAVAEFLTKEKEADLALKGAEFLGQAKDKSYSVLKPLHLLNAAESKDVLAAIEELLKYKGDARVSAALADKLSHKDAAIANASASALAKLSSTKELIAALSNGQVDAAVRLEIARSLGQDKDSAAKLVGFQYLANNAEERESIRSIAALAALKSADGRKAVEAFLTSPVAYRRASAAQELAQLKDPASLSAIAAGVKAAKDDAEVIEDAGYVIMASLSLKDILDQTRSKDNVIQRLAYRAVGERAVKEKAGAKVFDTLKAGLQNKDPMIRGAAARAMGELATKEAGESLKGLADDKSAEVRRDVAIALGKMPEGTLTDVLVKYLDDSAPGVAAAAMDSLSLRKEALAWDKIKALNKSSHDEVRAASLRALSRLVARGDKASVSEVISLLSGSVADKALEVRIEALRQLGTFKDDTAVASIAAQLNAKEEEVRMIAFEALGETGNASAAELAVAGLMDASVKVRREVVLALGKLRAKSSKKALQDHLNEEKDEEIIQLIKATIKKL